MKRIYLFLLACLAVHLAGFALPNSSVLLQHKGNVTVYLLEEFQKALDDAVDGDTLFLSKGTYPGFTIDKKITVRGAGQETIVNSGIIISIPDTVTLTSTLLEGLFVGYVYDYDRSASPITVKKSVNGLKIKQCHFGGISFTGKFYDVLIDRCFCASNFEFPNNDKNAVKSMIVKNSIINAAYPTDVTTKDIAFVNCNIRQFYYYWHSYASDFRGSLINCILSGGSSQNTLQSVTLINTLLNEYVISNTTYGENYYKETDSKLIDDYTLKCKYTDEQLLEKGYIGNDGTVVGCNGGSTPYTLTLAVPAVTASDVKLDVEQRKLNVNLTISAE